MSLNRSFLVERPTFREDPSSRRRKNYREEYQREKEKKRLLLFTFEKRTFDKEEFEKGEGGGKIELANRGGGEERTRRKGGIRGVESPLLLGWGNPRKLKMPAVLKGSVAFQSGQGGTKGRSGAHP